MNCFRVVVGLVVKLRGAHLIMKREVLGSSPEKNEEEKKRL